MIIPAKKLKCGFAMPMFGMGTWCMGGDQQRDPENDGQENIASLIAGLERGLTRIDTAEMYAEGFAEKIVGQAIKGRSRQQLFITSKVWSDNLSYDGVLRAAVNSLKRLNTSYLDLYLIHKPNDNFPLEETIKALDRLKNEGMIRNIGVSNFALERLARAQALSEHKIVMNQVHYNLLCREPETSGLLRYCQENDIFLEAWRPLQKSGFLSLKCEILEQICRKYRKTRPQIAINWLISQPNAVTISTMRSPKHIEENLGAVGWNMEPQDIALLRDMSGTIPISDAVPLK